MKTGHANILQAFNAECVGSKVTEPEHFMGYVEARVKAFDFDAQDTPGQGYMLLTHTACAHVSAGVGRHVKCYDDNVAVDCYVLRRWRGQVKAFLKREHAAPVDSVAVVVYTRAAYLSDPDVAGDAAEVARVDAEGLTHVIVAVLASAGPRSPLSPGRLVSNLAGGNKDALAWDADTIREKARESDAYASEWGVVAD